MKKITTNMIYHKNTLKRSILTIGVKGIKRTLSSLNPSTFKGNYSFNLYNQNCLK